MKTLAVYLRPEGSASGHLHSNQLFGAICWAVRTIFSEAKLATLLEQVSTARAFAVSSAFPCLFGAAEPVRFYPRPLLPEPRSDELQRLIEERVPASRREYNPKWEEQDALELNQRLKIMRKAAFVSEALFREIVAGDVGITELSNRLVTKGSQPAEIEVCGDSLITVGERKPVTDDPGQPLWSLHDVQRNGVDRVLGATVEGMLFFSHDLTFHRQKAGLWFALRAEEDVIEEFLRPAFRYLADTGIGGDRSTGKGHFAFDDTETSWQLPQAEQPNCMILLSRYLPQPGEFDVTSERLSYRLTTLRPKHETWHAAHRHEVFKGMLRLFEPGSILPIRTKQTSPILGRIVPLNAHSAGWQAFYNGLTLPVYARIAGTTT